MTLVDRHFRDVEAEPLARCLPQRRDVVGALILIAPEREAPASALVRGGKRGGKLKSARCASSNLDCISMLSSEVKAK